MLKTPYIKLLQAINTHYLDTCVTMVYSAIKVQVHVTHKKGADEYTSDYHRCNTRSRKHVYQLGSCLSLCFDLTQQEINYMWLLSEDYERSLSCTLLPASRKIQF